MFIFGIKYNPPFNTCLTVIKNLLPEIRTPDIIGESRWWYVLSLPEVFDIQNGDLLVWAKHKVYGFNPQHIALVVNRDEGFIYGLQGYVKPSEVSQVPFYTQNHLEYVKCFRPRFPVKE